MTLFLCTRSGCGSPGSFRRAGHGYGEPVLFPVSMAFEVADALRRAGEKDEALTGSRTGGERDKEHATEHERIHLAPLEPHDGTA